MKRFNIIMLVDAAGENVLMCHRLKPPYQGLYNLVGGKVKPGEDGMSAAYRELQEETGVTPSDVTLHHLVTFSYPHGGAGLPPYALEAYVGRLGRAIEVSGEENPLVWMPLTENFFDMTRFAGEGSIGHVVESVRRYHPALLEKRAVAHHEMSLRPGPFGKIADGSKRYELRLHDEKRRLISVGDTITFTCTEDERTVNVRVTSLHPFATFAELYASLPLTECGYTKENVAFADPRDMERYYPPEKQEHYGVLAIGIERIRLPIHTLNGEFAVRELTTADVPEMLRLARSNPLFYQYMRPDPTAENLAADLLALPPRRTLADKHFFGWFDGDELVAMMDLITHHPKPDMAFVGWFIVDGARQGCGLGRRLVGDVLAMLKAEGVTEVRLGRIEGNPQSKHFWRVCGFAENGLGYDTEDYHVIVMSKTL